MAGAMIVTRSWTIAFFGGGLSDTFAARQVTAPGVNVLVKGTTQGTQTDSDGRYTLANVPEGSTLVLRLPRL